MEQIIDKNDRNNQPTLVIGAGKMGKAYLEKLIASGIPENQITVVDIDQSKLDDLKKIYPAINTASEVPDSKFDLACVLSNSPAHLQNLETLAALEIPPAVIVEKPLITTAQLQSYGDKAEKLVDTLSRGYTAYLIDFSPAMSELLQFMSDNDLVVIQGKGNWEKNRTADKRPTAGDLEDEMTHQLASLMALARMNQTINNVAVSARLTYLDYVDKTAQQALANLDSSIPANPNSATRLDVELVTDQLQSPVLLSMWSSFTSPEQARVIQVELSNGGAAPEYAAQIIFDDPKVKGDILKIWKYPEKEPTVITFENPDKLGLQLNAFLRAAETGKQHPALKHLKDGLDMVKLAQAAVDSHQQRSVFIDVPFDI